MYCSLHAVVESGMSDFEAVNDGAQEANQAHGWSIVTVRNKPSPDNL